MNTVFKGQGNITIPLAVFDSSGVPYTPASVGIKIYLASTLIINTNMTQSFGLPNIYTYDFVTTAMTAGNYIVIFQYQDGSGNDIYISDSLQIADLNFLGTGGSKELIETLVDLNSGDVLPGRVCWLNTAALGTGVSTVSKVTNDSGMVTFFVNPGTYYLFSDIQQTYIKQITVV